MCYQGLCGLGSFALPALLPPNQLTALATPPEPTREPLSWSPFVPLEDLGHAFILLFSCPSSICGYLQCVPGLVLCLG